MKYCSFITPNGSATWGAEHADRIYDLGLSGLRLTSTLKESLQTGLFNSIEVATITEAPSYSIDEVNFQPVIPDPAKIICIGVNYKTHQKETGKQAPPAPTVFTRFADSQMGHRAPAIYPTSSQQFDYEGELALIIGRPAHHMAPEDVGSVIAGYSIYNDFSVRDWQRASSQWTPGKNFPNTGAFGPYLVPAADVRDVSQLQLETRVNGEVRQSALIADLVFDIPTLIAHITAFTPLAAGDVIVTGTPGGVGLFMEPSGLLSIGDLVEVEITGLGTLQNTVCAEPTTTH